MKEREINIDLDSMKSLKGRNIIVYDLEIKNVIDGKEVKWSTPEKMGISVGCAFDYRDYKYRVFMDDNMQELVDRMNEPSTVIVAFNHIQFDNNLLRKSGYDLKPDSELLNYDMMLVSKKGANTTNPFHKGFRLDDHLKHLKLPMKTANGAMAPVWWQEGKIGTVIDYCLNDVTQEKSLFEYMTSYKEAACEAFPKPFRVKDYNEWLSLGDEINEH